ncbi:MAG: cytochrome ubiquinol oxidase subunit I [Alphaproteobacteria bacterium]|nr:cytochrome ubiquinol oxidase subunit I [Alphaproteobacteria bacterium]
MEDLLAARSQMALSLGFHMIFATLGMGLPLFMVLAEALWLRTGDAVWLQLAKAWSKGAAILFAVGAVSGTVLSFELGLLWPRFMELAGPVIGLPFSLEGFAFFFEAIFLGVYLYGWENVSRRAHLLAGVGVLVSGMLSGMFVVTVNAWMNTPAGFDLGPDGSVVAIRPVEAMLNPSAFGQALHMAVAAPLATAFAVLGVHAWRMRQDPTSAFHRRALGLALGVATLCALAQPLTGHVVGEQVAHTQPVKLAAMEGLWETHPHGAPFVVGGWPDEDAEVTGWGVEIPYLLSVLAYGDPTHAVMGLKEVPRADRPPVLVTHLAYQTMLASMGIMAGLVAVAGVLVARARRVPDAPWFLTLCVLASPWGIVGVEAGWTATEVGRQPWVIGGVMRTSEAVTPMPGLAGPFLAFTLLYAVLGVVTTLLLVRQFEVHSPRPEVRHVGA